MTDENKPLGLSSEPTPGNEEPAMKEYPESQTSGLGLKLALVLFALVAAVGVGYGWMQHHAVQELAASRDQLSASLSQVRTQADDLTNKLNALAAQQAQPPVPAQAPNAEAAPIRNEAAPQHEAVQRHVTHHVVVRRPPPDDPRWKQVQNQLSEQQQELAESRQQIAAAQTGLQQARSELQGNIDSARNELGGGIARNHDELVALQRKGERNYYEFDLLKSKAFQHTGPIGIELRKANVKHQYCDLNMLVNDAEVTRKHINLYESVTFYPEGYPQPVELVINRISKDEIRGYVSEPKYRSPVKAASSAPAAQTAPAASSTTAAVTTNDDPATANVKLQQRTDTAQ
jgi:chaperonin cofactor prefoldin